MNARAGEADHPSPSAACEVTTLSNRLHPVAGPKRQRRKLVGPLQPRAVLGVEKLHEPMKLLVRELLRHLRDLAQQLIVGHCGSSLPGISTPELDGGSPLHGTERGRARRWTDEASAALHFFLTSDPAPGLRRQ